MSKRYKNSPIIEALCEIQFEPSAGWDLTVPGLIYEEIKDTFSKRLQLQPPQISLNDIDTMEITGQIVPLMRFQRTDDLALIQIGPNLLTVNYLKPYSSWEEFFPLIERGLTTYRKVVNPNGIQRITLRYINRIEIPTPIILEKYFEFRPFIAKKLQTINAFIAGIQIPYQDNRDILNIQLSSMPDVSPDKAAILLDLSYLLVNPGAITWDVVSEWIQVAHESIEEMFEASITEDLRLIFEEIKQ